MCITLHTAPPAAITCCCPSHQTLHESDTLPDMTQLDSHCLLNRCFLAGTASCQGAVHQHGPAVAKCLLCCHCCCNCSLPLAALGLQTARWVAGLAVAWCALLAEEVADVEPEAAGTAAHQCGTNRGQAAVGVSQRAIAGSRQHTHSVHRLIKQ